jgi:cbb3-type cytochrome oxidase subunit 3
MPSNGTLMITFYILQQENKNKFDENDKLVLREKQLAHTYKEKI